MYTTKHFEVNGFEYRTWDDIEEDNIKTFHECYCNGKRIEMPRGFYNHSPYSLYNRAEFAEWTRELEVWIQAAEAAKG